ncbi:hypothetical protein BKA64DRAFT_745169 [Cadophora sp. MPI-SDFR-AT-0126]|nr:hypothetical protein BKA64DRAFT_745169 [Leotiomycetes sp. MPI-SDFR-AT-0126]
MEKRGIYRILIWLSFSISIRGQATVQVIQVGTANGSLIFSPESLDATIGSFIQFQFLPVNHSVTQSNFDTPCQRESGGFDSGFQPVRITETTATPVFTIEVNNTDPMYFFCGQARHCQAGMVGAINAPRGALGLYKIAAATAVPTTTSAGSSSSTSASTTTSATSDSKSSSTNSASQTESTNSQTSSASSPTDSTTSRTPKSSSGQVSPGLIAAIVLGTLAILLLAAGFWILWKRVEVLVQLKESRRTTAPRALTAEDLDLTKMRELEVIERAGELGNNQRRPVFELPERLSHV